MYQLGQLVGLASFVCAIMVVIKQFQQKGALHGVLGILSCFIYTFIWGWLNATRLNIKKLMLIWTILWVVSAVLSIMFRPAMPSLEGLQP
jgi:hypothetical protein